jgi:hypothetical protein
LLPVVTPVHERIPDEPVKVAEPSTVSVTGNVLVVTVPAPTPELVHILMATASCVATDEVEGTVPVVLRRKVPALGVPQAFPVPLLPPEVAVTVVIFIKGVKVAKPSTVSVTVNPLPPTVPTVNPGVVQPLRAARSSVATDAVVGMVLPPAR